MQEDNNILISVIAGLAVGIAFIGVFAWMFAGQTTGLSKGISVVVIPKDAALATNNKNTFEPREIKVVIGINNTVRWENRDSLLAEIEADNQSDPDFYNATKGFVTIQPSQSFEYTFTKTGEFGYHGRPWQRGNVTVLPAS